MSDNVAAAVIARAIKSEILHPLGAMRHLHVSEDELALSIINALEDAGFEVVRRDQQPSG